MKTILRALLPLLLIGLSHLSRLDAGEASWRAEWDKTLAARNGKYSSLSTAANRAMRESMGALVSGVNALT